MAQSNAVMAGVNLVAALLSIPILAAGIWLATQPDNSCVQFLQWPLIAAGVAVLVVALAGSAGAFWRVPGLLLFYLVAMLALLLLLAGLVIFIYAVTLDGAAHRAPGGRAYLEYRLEDYSGWLRQRVEGSGKWNRIKKCLSSSTAACAEMNRTYTSAQEFFETGAITPLQSGCCKPPSACVYTFVNPTYWISPISAASDIDCVLWSNDQSVLCYSCSSCKAGLLASLRREWRRADVVLAVTLAALIVVYTMACFAFRKAKTQEIFQRYKQGYAATATPDLRDHHTCH